MKFGTDSEKNNDLSTVGFAETASHFKPSFLGPLSCVATCNHNIPPVRINPFVSNSKRTGKMIPS